MHGIHRAAHLCSVIMMVIKGASIHISPMMMMMMMMMSIHYVHTNVCLYYLLIS